MPAGRSNASSLLKKVNSQLKGERVPLQSKDEDELAVYLQTLSKKTQQAQSIDYEDHGDISISSSADAIHTPRHQRSQSPVAPVKISEGGSKFLKKKTNVEIEPEQETKKSSEILIQGKKKAAVPTTKSTIVQPARTSALEKANALTNKISSRAAGIPLRRTRSGGSESDDSTRGADIGVKRPGSADTNTSIGHDANRFLKTRKAVVESVDAGQRTRSPSPQLQVQRSVSVEKPESPKKSSKTKGEIVRTLGKVYLTSEEESLAEFIHGLSTSETSKKPQNLVAKKQQKWRKKTPSPAGRQSPIQMSRSPSPFKNRSPSPFGRFSHSQSQDSDMMESMASEIDDKYKQQDSDHSDDNKFGLNVMDIASLGPATSSPDLRKNRKNKKSRPSSAGKKSSSATSTSIFKASVPNVFKADRLTDSISIGKKSDKQTKKSSSKKDDHKSHDLFGSLGIQMADDLLDFDLDADVDEKPLGIGEKKGKQFYEKEVTLSEENSDSEIQTENSMDRRRKQRKNDSDSEIKTESKSRKAPLQRQDSVEDSVSERLNERSSFGNIHMASTSEEKEDYETEADYSDSFVSESTTITPTVTHKSSSWKKRKSHKDSSSKSNVNREHKVVMEEKRVDISATDDQGRTHYWNTAQNGISVMGPSFGLQYVDPAPIASHVVSADAIEAMTAYSPNMLALQDMMRSQLQLISSFVDIQKRIYHSCLDGLNEDHQYTTLQDTKQYIEKNRKPRMTMEEALKLVDLEDGIST